MGRLGRCLSSANEGYCCLFPFAESGGLALAAGIRIERFWGNQGFKNCGFWMFLVSSHHVTQFFVHMHPDPTYPVKCRSKREVLNNLASCCWRWTFRAFQVFGRNFDIRVGASGTSRRFVGSWDRFHTVFEPRFPTTPPATASLESTRNLRPCSRQQCTCHYSVRIHLHRNLPSLYQTREQPDITLMSLVPQLG